MSVVKITWDTSKVEKVMDEYFLVDDIEPEATAIHGIDKKTLIKHRAKDTFKKARNRIKRKLKQDKDWADSRKVAYNASVDQLHSDDLIC